MDGSNSHRWSQRVRAIEVRLYLLFQVTVKPVQNVPSKIDKTKILITIGSLMKVKSIAEFSPWSILQVLLTCIKRYLVLKTRFWSFWEWPFYTGFTIHEKMNIHLSNGLSIDYYCKFKKKLREFHFCKWRWKTYLRRRKSWLDHGLPTSVNGRLILPFHEDFIYLKLRNCKVLRK